MFRRKSEQSRQQDLYNAEAGYAYIYGARSKKVIFDSDTIQKLST